jgi:hypothetical protein
MATVRHVTARAGRTKYQAAWFLVNRLYKTVRFLVYDARKSTSKIKDLVAARVKFIFLFLYCRDFQVCKLCVTSGLKMESAGPSQILLLDAWGLCVLPRGYHVSNATKGKAVPLQARCGPEGCRRFRLPDFHDIRYMKVVRSASRIGRLYPQECSWYQLSSRTILVLLESCLQPCMTYTSAESTVNKLLMMGRGTAQNM